MSKNWLTRTLRGADVMSSDGFLSAVPTSPNSVLTQRLPSWKPVCAASFVPWQVLPRICSRGATDGAGDAAGESVGDAAGESAGDAAGESAGDGAGESAGES